MRLSRRQVLRAFGWTTVAISSATIVVSLPGYDASRFGNLGEWVAGVLSSAVIATAFMAMRREDMAERDRREAAQRVRAAKVTIQVERGSTGGTTAYVRSEVTYRVTNGGDLPIFDCIFRLEFGEGWSVHNPLRSGVQSTPSGQEVVIGDLGASVEHAMKLVVRGPTPFKGVVPVQPVLSWTDGEGTRWRVLPGRAPSIDEQAPLRAHSVHMKSENVAN